MRAAFAKREKRKFAGNRHNSLFTCTLFYRIDELNLCVKTCFDAARTKAEQHWIVSTQPAVRALAVIRWR
jgi:hypothetical protein